MDNNEKDLMSFSNSENIDISSSSHSKHSAKKRKRKKSKKRTLKILCIILAVIFALLAAGLIFANSLLGKVNKSKDFNEDSLGANDVFKDSNVKNIAFFGIDSRKNSFSGRSDSIMIVTLDKKHDKIKLSSIARDTYVAIDGHDHDKLTHAYVFGGAELAVKTLNQNFNLDITDYVTTNFFGFTSLIDSIGGVELDVDSQEMDIINNKYYRELNRIGLTYDKLTTTGMQTLTGAQALAYSRNRYSAGGDVDRGNKQKEVLSVVYDKVKKVSLTKYPGMVSSLLENCETSLSNKEILGYAAWAATSSPTIENLSLPDKECNPKSGSEAFKNGVWYYFYDMDIATKKLHDFINDVMPSSSSETSSVAN